MNESDISTNKIISLEMCVVMLYYGVLSLPEHDVHQLILGLGRLVHPHVCGVCTE